MNGTSPLRSISTVLTLVSVFAAVLLLGCGSNATTLREGRSSQPLQSANSASLVANKSPLPATTNANASQEIPADSSSRGSSTDLAVVKSVRANLRELPNVSSSVLEEVRQGDALTLVSRSPVGPWYRVRHGETGAEGWIHGNGIVITNAAHDVGAGTSRRQEQEQETASRAAKGAPEAGAGGTTTDRYYRNVDGELVRSPTFSNTVPGGATARCRDGSYSFSKHRRGTCSHHGGVAEWLRSDIP